MALTRMGVPAATFKLTSEQARIKDEFDAGNNLVVEALAGTGKTSTLRALAAGQPTRPGVYLAFNRSIVLEAQGRFPQAVKVTTAHSLAYQAIGKPYGHRLGSARMPAKAMASRLRVNPARLDTGTLNPVVLTRMAQATVNQFMKTADPFIAEAHIPTRVFANHSPQEIGKIVVPIAQRIWEDLTRTDGRFFFSHDVYLKLWQLTNPNLPFDYILFDEAQDSDPVIASIVGSQRSTQTVYVGDQNQAIYGWRGAVDAMGKVQGATRLPLTKSFRFGPAIAEQANEWLELLGAKHRVVGFEKIESTVGQIDIPRAILCRGNGTALGWVLAFHERGIPVALAPGDKDAGKDLARFAWAAKDLMNEEGTDHPDLVGFTTWKQLVEFVEEEENTADLKRMVNIVNRIGVGGVIDAVRGLVTEDKATCTVSTAHKAKGLEWTAVKVADDFTPPEPNEEGEIEVDPSELMLAYVTVTRAKDRLDPGALGSPEMWSR